MIKQFISIIAIFTLAMAAYGQIRTELLEIKPSKKKYSNALYNKIKYFDARTNKSCFGIVRVGSKDKLALVVPKTPMKTQIEQALISMIDSTAKNDTLFLLINEFQIFESNDGNDIGKSYFNADVFCLEKNRCYKINTIDTTLKFDFGSVVSAMLIASSANIILDFISKSLYKIKHDTLNFLDFTEIISKESIEKKKIPVYSNIELRDGVYYNYVSFKEQKPDHSCTIEINKYDSAVEISVFDEKGKEINTDNIIFAAVYKGKCYYNPGEEYDNYVELKKEGNDFYFISIPDYKAKRKTEFKSLLIAASYSGNTHIPDLNGSVMTFSPLIPYLIDKDMNKHKSKMRMQLDYKTGLPIFTAQSN